MSFIGAARRSRTGVVVVREVARCDEGSQANKLVM
jgi:hypothetical protein